MIYIILAILAVSFTVVARLKGKDVNDDVASLLEALLALVFIGTMLVMFSMLSKYNVTKSTVDRRIQVLEEQNGVVLQQLEPIVEKYLQYERDTFKELKQNPQTLLALSMYPELKGNKFVQSQINIMVSNQEEITDLKMRKAMLNSYRFWIFMGE